MKILLLVLSPIAVEEICEICRQDFPRKLDMREFYVQCYANATFVFFVIGMESSSVKYVGKWPEDSNFYRPMA